MSQKALSSISPYQYYCNTCVIVVVYDIKVFSVDSSSALISWNKINKDLLVHGDTMNTRWPFSGLPTDQGAHPPHLKLHQQCSSAEGGRPPPLCPGSDGGPACQSEEQRAEEQIPTSTRTPQQGPHAAVTTLKNHVMISLGKTLLKFENEGLIYSCIRRDSIVIQPFFLSSPSL